MLPIRLVHPRNGWGLGGFFDEAERNVNRLANRLLGASWEPAWTPYGVEISEDEKNIYVEAELPGLQSKDVDVTLDNNILTIRGEKRDEQEDKNREYHLREARFCKFERSFHLPDTVDGQKVSANVKDGVLHVTLEKKPEARPKKIEVKGD